MHDFFFNTYSRLVSVLYLLPRSTVWPDRPLLLTPDRVCQLGDPQRESSVVHEWLDSVTPCTVATPPIANFSLPQHIYGIQQLNSATLEIRGA